jgi:hypothetical protein
MSKEGTRFIATGIYTKHVLEQLKTDTRRRPFDWMLGLFAAFLASVTACSPSMRGNTKPGETNAKQELTAHLKPQQWIEYKHF